MKRFEKVLWFISVGIICVLVGISAGMFLKIDALEEEILRQKNDINYISDKAGVELSEKNVRTSWEGMVWCSYGDSITQESSWQDYVTDYFGFSKHYNRGIGSSAFVKTEQIWYANPDGSYNSRYGIGDVYEAPAGTTEHEGYLCSWDRITTQIPKEVDLVIVNGGTNDSGIWINAPIGDLSYPFDETTFMGAVASTVVKIQEHVPNATIVLMSPLSGRGPEDEAEMYKNQTQPFVNDIGLTVRDYAIAMEEVAHYLSIPFIDLFATTGINEFNRTQYIRDICHPNAEGGKAIARVIIGALEDIAPIVK
jgi:lysophospholipase L1-like esterase